MQSTSTIIEWNLGSTSVVVTTTSSRSSNSSPSFQLRGGTNDKSPADSSFVRTVFLDNVPFEPVLGRSILLDGAPNVEFVDATQYYHKMDSSDADDTMERKIFPEHEQYNTTCTPLSTWQTTFHPTCNEFHSHSMLQDVNNDALSILSTKGFWRYAWELQDEQENSNSSATTNHASSIVFKNLKLDHSYEEAYYENNRVDAVSMERLTSSPYVVDIYGYCGMSVYTEYAGQAISNVVDKLPPLEKLKLAQQVAQGVADVHTIDGDEKVSLVHNDLNFANIVISERTGLPLINDFNVAILQMQDKETGDICPFTSHYPNPQWRSPEEQVDEETGTVSTSLSEKVDIYGLGNVMYRFAVGKSPWKKKDGGSLSKEEKLAIARAKLKDGALPHIPSRIRKSDDPATKALLKIMRECYRHRPELRPTAKQVVDMLQEAIDDLESGENRHNDEAKERRATRRR